MKFRVDVAPASAGGVITSVLRFGPDDFYGFAFGAPNDLVVMQQSGEDYEVLGRVPLQAGMWYVARLVYREGPVLEASLNGVPIALDQNPLMEFSHPTDFHAGVTYAPAPAKMEFEIDSVRVF